MCHLSHLPNENIVFMLLFNVRFYFALYGSFTMFSCCHRIVLWLIGLWVGWLKIQSLLIHCAGLGTHKKKHLAVFLQQENIVFAVIDQLNSPHQLPLLHHPTTLLLMETRECVFCYVLQAPHPSSLTGFTWVEGLVLVNKAGVYIWLIHVFSN